MQQQVRVTRSVSMGHRLPTYNGLCSSPHGHNLRVEVRIGAPDSQFTDFKAVDAALARVLEPLDHAMVLDFRDPLAAVLRGMSFRVLKLNCEPTTEALAAYVFNALHDAFGWRVHEVVAFETDKYSASAYEPNPNVRVML